MRSVDRGPEQQACQTDATAATPAAVSIVQQALALQVAQKVSEIALHLLSPDAVVLGNPRHGCSGAVCQRFAEHAGADRRHRVEATPHVEQPSAAICNHQEDHIRG